MSNRVLGKIITHARVFRGAMLGVATIALLSAASAVPDDQSRAARHTLATGVVTRDGAPVENATVEVLMLESSTVSAAAPAGARVNTIEVAVVRTDHRGWFIVAADIGSLANRPGFVEKTDQVSNFQVTAWDDHSELVWAFPASPALNRSFWRTQHSPDAPAQLVFDLGSQAKAYELANNPATWIDAANAAPVATIQRTQREREAREQDGNCWFEWRNVYWLDRLERFINIHNDDNSRATSRQAESVTHTLGIAAQTSGGWTSGGTAAISLGAGVEVVAAGIVDRALYNSVNMRQKVRLCDYGVPPRYFMQTVSTHTMLKKISAIAFYRYAYGPNHAVGQPGGTTYSLTNSTNATFATGLDTPYVDLSAQSGWGSANTLSFYVPPYQRSAHYWTHPHGPVQSGNWSWEDE